MVPVGHFQASLPMYNLPEMAGLNAAFWRAFRDVVGDRGVTLPEGLDFARPAVPEAIGTEVIFTQTCGYPLQTIYRDQFQLLGVPTYAAPGCGDATHCAFVVVRDDSAMDKIEDLRGKTFAVNSLQSNSGMNLPRRLIAPLAEGRPYFREVKITRTHPASMSQVAAGEVDGASIDCMTYAFHKDHSPELVARLRVIARTPESPAIPFITSASTARPEVEILRAALVELSARPEHRPLLDALRIKSIGPADPSAYRRVLAYEREAIELGYPDLV